MKLSVCMIVKNEEKILEKTLPNLSKFADEIILVDTGSNDGTLSAAKKFGAKIYHFAWINDFSAARNESLKHAAGDWILWIDADEFMTEEDLKTLRAELETSAAEAHSFTLYESNIDACEKKNGYERAKVFKHGSGYRFERPINEQLVNEKGEVVSGELIPVNIYHWGRRLEAERMNEKRERYVKLYSAALEKMPDDPHLHFLLANNLNELKKLPEALEHYRRAYELAGKREVGRQALEKKADILLRTRSFKEAVAAADELLRIEPDNIPARNIYAGIFLISGKIDLAIGILQDALAIKVEPNNCWEGKVENLYQSKAMPNFLLGKAFELKGEKEKAKACYDRAKDICPEIYGGK